MKTYWKVVCSIGVVMCAVVFSFTICVEPPWKVLTLPIIITFALIAIGSVIEIIKYKD